MWARLEREVKNELKRKNLEQLRLQHTHPMSAKINMDAVLAEFKALFAYEKRCFQSMSKHEQRELRAQRKAINQYVEQVIVEWRATKAEETACETPEWWNWGIDRWDTRNPPSNIFQMEHALELPDSQKMWLQNVTR